MSSSALSSFILNPQPPVLAVVTQITTGPPDLVFGTVAENGITWTNNASNLSANGVDSLSLDQITAPDALTRAALIDKFVVGLKDDGETQYSFEFAGTVIDVYVVNGVASVLVKTSTGFFYELPVIRILILPNR